MVNYKKFINSIILLLFIVTSGIYAVIEPLRYIEIIAPVIILLFLIQNRFVIQNDIIFKLLVFSFFFIFLRTIIETIIDFNAVSLLGFRLISSIIVFLAFFILSSHQKYFTLYPVIFFLILSLLLKFEVYKYFGSTHIY